MKTFKRALSGFLAMLMVFSTFSVLAIATVGDGNQNSVEMYTDFYVKNGDDWVKTDKVKAGDTVEARVSIVTDFYVGGSVFFWVYSKDFMTLDTEGYVITNEAETGNSYSLKASGATNTSATSITGSKNWDGFFVHSEDVVEYSIADNLCYEEYIGGSYDAGLEYFEDKGWICLFLQTGTPAIGDKSEHIFKFTFKVKDTPTVDEGFFYMPEESLADPDERSYAPGGIIRAESPTSMANKVDEQAHLMKYNVALNDTNTIKLFTETSTTYTQNVYTMDTTGAYGAAESDEKTGDIGATVKTSDYKVPDGFSLDTTKSTGDVVLADDGSSVVNIYLSRNKYNVSFDGVVTEQYYGATIAPETAAPVLGKTFAGWYAGETLLTATATVPVGGAAYTSKYTPNEVGYTVNKYFMNVAGEYLAPETESFPGKTDDVVSYADANIEGFVLNTSKGTLSGTVTGDGKLVLNAYYDRKLVGVQFEGVDAAPVEYRYGATVNVPATATAPEGQSFDYWTLNGAKYEGTTYVVTEEAATFVPVFKNNSYDVNYYVDGKLVYTDEDVEYKAEAALEAGDAYVPAGYNFVGWSTVEDSADDIITKIDSMPANDVDLYAIYEAATTVEYTVEFFKQTLEGGYESAGTEEYQNGTTGEEAPYVVDTDKFEGFVFNADASILDDVVAGDGSTVLEVYYDRKVVYVKFDGVDDEAFPYMYGETIDVPESAPATQPGYTFDYWEINGEKVEGTYTVTAEDVTLTPVFKKIPRTITYVYVGAPEGYNAPAATTGVIGDPIVLPELPTVDGYTISDWVVTGDDNGLVGTKNVTVTATWTQDVYTVIFWKDEAGTVLYDEQTYTYGKALEYPATDPSLPGFSFDGWSEIEGAEVTESFDVYPTYTAIEYYVTVNGLYDANVDLWVAYYGDEIVLADLLTKEYMDEMLVDNGDYYTFDGWYYNGDEITDETVITVTEDVLIYGEFTAMDAQLTFNAAGAVFAESGTDTYVFDAIKYDDIITAEMYPAIPEFEGHTFKSWDPNVVGQPMDELEKEITITWTKNSYNVKFVNGLTGEELGTVSGKFGDAVEAPALPVAEGYSFAWDNNVTSIPARNEKGELMVVGGTMTVTAVPTAVTYAVNYYVDGEIYTTLNVAYGKPVESIAAPAADELPSGYSFLGWSLDENATLPGNLGVVGAGEVNVYAVLQANGDVAYAVEIYKQTLEGGYELADTQKFTNGTTGKVAPFVIDTDVEGFVFNAEASVLDEPVAGDGSTVLEVYYDRKTIIVDINGKEEDVIYGETIDLPDDVDDGDEGTEFDKWVDEKGNEVSDPYTVPDSDKPIILVPTFTNKTYTITYYNDGASIYSEDVAYKTAVELIDGAPYMSEGYIFVGWTLVEGSTEIATIDTMPAHDVELYAIYEADTAVGYTVEFYKQTLEGGYESAGTEEYQNGTTGEEAPYVVDTDKFEGFVFNADASILDEPVAGDGSTILEVYYDRKTIIVDINGEEKEVVYGETIDLPNDVDDGDEGTTFDKWVDEDGNAVSDPYTVPDSDKPIVLKPTYKNNSFEVKFVDELAGTVKSSTLVYGDKIPNPGSPSVEGYEFKGWFTAAGDKYVAGTTTVPNAAVTYYAKYDGLDVDYTVNVYFEKLGGGWEDVQSEVLSGVAGKLAVYSETFEGFTLDKTISTTEAVVKADGTTTLNVYFTRNDITIIVDGEEVKVPYGTEIDEDDLDADVEPGYKLDKWVDDEGNEIEFPVTIKGGEEFIPVLVKESYALKFQLADGTVLSETVAEFGADITAPEAPDAAEGFTFAGWVDKATNEPFNGKMPAKETVYVAVYSNNEEASFTFNIYVMNTKGVEELIASFPGKAPVGTTQSVVPGSYEFCTLDAERSNTSCVVLADGTAKINLYFVRGLYTVSFDGVETQVYAGANIPVPADPTDFGRTFTGWTPAIPDLMPENDIAFTSTWEDVTYTITYIVNGDEIVQNYKYGDIVTAYKVTEAPAGLTFKGWSAEIPEVMPAENITVSAVFEAAAYTVTYLDADGNVFVSYSVAFGAEIPVPADAPTKEFYTFAGWASAPATMPAENITIAPIFEPVAVKLIAAPGSTTVIDRENMVIYGLEEGVTAKSLDDDFIDYEGDGRLVIKPVTEGTSRYGTGAVVELYDNADGSLVETFHIVIFGDLDGNARVTSNDYSIASDEAFWITDWSLEDSAEYAPYKLIAADLDHSGHIDTGDVTSIKNYVVNIVDIDQVEGKVIRS